MFKVESSSNLKSGNMSFLNGKMSSGVLNKNINMNNKKGRMYFSGWVKYVQYMSTGSSIPEDFYINPEFAQQFIGRPDIDLSKKSPDELGNMIKENIPTPFHFFATVFDNQLVIGKSRIIKNYQAYDTLSMDEISPCKKRDMNELLKYMGKRDQVSENELNKHDCVIDLGKFNEGYCIKIEGTKKNWVLCSESSSSKDILYRKLVEMKIKNQGMLDESGEYNMDNKNDESLDQYFSGDDNKQQSEKNKKKVDGKWIILQNWSQCSLKCGGGVSTLHRLCIPPQNGGNPCEGNPILTKPCNTDPCPSQDTNQDSVMLKPIIKTMPYTSVKERYIKCKVKETEMFFIDYSMTPSPLIKGSNALEKPQIPIRVVMNPQTISFFFGPKYSSLLYSFNMDKTVFSRPILNKKNMEIKGSCFNLTSIEKRVELCPMAQSSGATSILEQWDYDFHLFKLQCHEDKKKEDFDLEEELRARMEKAKLEILEERENKIKRQHIQEEVTTQRKIVQHANTEALKALQRELEIEELLKEEENERQKLEEQELLEQLKLQKEKQECIEKSIKEKEMENQLNRGKLQAQNEIVTIQESAKDEINKRRQKLKDYFVRIRADNKLKLQNIKEKYETEILQSQNRIRNAYKRGDQMTCYSGVRYEIDRRAYCKANFSEEPNKYNNCMSNVETFCSICCNNEFGSFYENERLKCSTEICQHIPTDRI